MPPRTSSPSRLPSCSDSSSSPTAKAFAGPTAEEEAGTFSSTEEAGTFAGSFEGGFEEACRLAAGQEELKSSGRLEFRGHQAHQEGRVACPGIVEPGDREIGPGTAPNFVPASG